MRTVPLAPLFEAVLPLPYSASEATESLPADGRVIAGRDKSYQVECPSCRSVAALEATADAMQTFIRGVLPRAFSPPFSQERSREQLTPRQHGASEWSFAIRDCLRRAMATHPRCGACTVLMGPGHAEAGIETFCGTHTEKVARRPRGHSTKG